MGSTMFGSLFGQVFQTPSLHVAETRLEVGSNRWSESQTYWVDYYYYYYYYYYSS